MLLSRGILIYQNIQRRRIFHDSLEIIQHGTDQLTEKGCPVRPNRYLVCRFDAYPPPKAQMLSTAFKRFPWFLFDLQPRWCLKYRKHAGCDFPAAGEKGASVEFQTVRIVCVSPKNKWRVCAHDQNNDYSKVGSYLCYSVVEDRCSYSSCSFQITMWGCRN